MKKLFFAAILLGGLASNELAAQKYLGLSNSNYSGVYGSQYNPAKLADTKVKFAFNLATMNAGVNNDFYKLRGLDLKLDNFGNNASYDVLQKTMKFGLMTEILGPSVQFTTSDRLGFGFSSRMRVFGQGNNLDTKFMRALSDNIGGLEILKNNSVFGINAHLISDLGVGGSYAVVDNEKIRLSLGATAKLYSGIASNSFESRGYDINYRKINNTTRLDINDVNWDFYTSVKEGDSAEKLFNSFNVGTLLGSGSNVGRGFGGNVGAELTLKDEMGEKPYALKFGASVNDIGAIEYKNLRRINVTGRALDIDPEKIDFADVDATTSYLKSKGLTVVNSNIASRTVDLSTNLTLYADYAISKKIFVSANGLVDLSSNKEANPHYYNYVNLTPRFETKWFDVAVPVSYNFMSKDVKPGLALRVGPLSVGSDDLTALIGNAKGANVYAGLGFILYKPKKDMPPVPAIHEVDTDGDGVLDKNDACPNQAGPAENNGCPWSDSDNDGIIDRDDACPHQAGPAENNGCPWPDSDNDGIIDRDDKCPNEFGLREYNGCPKPAEVVAVEATGALKDIIFNFGKATISEVSNEKLNQAAKLIKSVPNGTFLVTGHTDKKGNQAYNLKLSRERAAAVVKALESRGVAEKQLKSTGVGSRDAKMPATASNEERAKDRKVVVEAINGAAWAALQKSDLPVVKKKVVKKTTTKKPSTKRRR